MKKLFVISAFILIGSSAFSQVGINNTDPKASLDITASSLTTPSNTDGILIPRVDEFPATAPGVDQDGLMVFATGSGTPAKGFYFWDNTGGVWIGFGGTNNTLDEAYDQGGAGAGRNIDASDGAMTINGDDGLVVTGTFGAGNIIDTDVSGAGTRLFFNPNKGTIRAGAVSGVQWDDTNIGQYSAAFGFDNIASGNISFAMGLGNTASAESATAFGSSNTASGQESVTFGNQNTASGLRSIATGTLSTASGDYSFASGETAEASALNAIAIGNGTIANATDAVAIGKTSEAKNTLATAIGGGDAQGVSSVSIGEGTQANSFSEIALGTFNTGYVPNSLTAFDSDDRLLVVGNGTSNGNRNNALTLLKNGYMGLNTDTPRNPFEVDISTTFDLSYANTGQDGIFIVGQGDNSGANAVGGSISFGPPSSTRGTQRKSAIASVQTSGDVDHTGLAFYVHGNAINMSDMVEGMRLTHNRRLGINNNDPSANLDVIGTMQYEDGNEAAGFIMASDASGNASWVDPTSLLNLVEKIDDLSDGKSDSDGTQDGSSVFLGINAGAADDSSDNHNVGVGFQALENNLTGENNTGVGYLALNANDTGSQNTAVGQSSLYTNIAGTGNTGIGYHALFANTGSNNTAVGNGSLENNMAGEFNAALGTQALTFNTAGSNTAMGYRASYSNNAGTRNAAFGLQSLNFNVSGNDNVAVGYRSGYTATGSGNVYLGSEAGNGAVGDNTLFIENTGADEDNALIYGEFGADATTTGNIFRTNGELQIGNPTGTGYAFPTTDGAVNNVLQTDGNGQLSFGAPVGDGTGTDDQTIDNFSFDSTTNVLSLEIEDDGIAPQTVDLSALNPTKAIAKIRMTSNQSLSGNSTTKINFTTSLFDIGSNFDTTFDRFVAPRDGVYRINAQTNSLTNTTTTFYSIYVYVNGSLNSASSYDHTGSGRIERQIDTLVELTTGDFIEIYFRHTANATIDPDNRVTYFQIEEL